MFVRFSVVVESTGVLVSPWCHHITSTGPDPRCQHTFTSSCRLQDKCSLLQVDCADTEQSEGSVELLECLVDKATINAVPLAIEGPEGTGGSGCSAEVATAAEALRAAALGKASRSKPGTSEAQQAGGAEASGGRPVQPDTASSDATTPASTALIECSVCHRKPGDPDAPATLMLCGGCKGARYCSIACQRKDWKLGHKGLCNLIQKSCPKQP
jgi:hypothetical protein